MISLSGIRKSMRAWLKWGVIAFLLIFTVGIFFGYMSFSLHPKESSAPSVMAVIDGTKLDRDVFMQAVARQEEEYEKQSRFYGARPIINKYADTWRAAFNDLSETILLSEEIKRRKLKVSKDEVNAELDKRVKQIIEARWPDEKTLRRYLLRKGITRQQLEQDLRSQFNVQAIKQQLLEDKLKQEIVKDVKVTEADLKQSYESVTAYYLRIRNYPEGKESPDEAKAAAEKKVKAVQEGLKANKDFEELAVKYSEDAVGARTFRRGELLSELNDKVFNAKTGEVVGPIDTKYGIFFFKILKKQVDLPKDYEKNKAKLLNDLLEKRKEKSWDDFREALKQRATIEVKDPLLAGIYYLSQGEKEKATEAFKQALEVYKESPEAYAVAAGWLGRLAQFKKDYQEAEKYYKEATQSSGDATLYLWLGETELKLKHKKEALDALATASELATSEPSIHQQLATLYEKELKDKEKAEQEKELEQEYYRSLFTPAANEPHGTTH